MILHGQYNIKLTLNSWHTTVRIAKAGSVLWARHSRDSEHRMFIETKSLEEVTWGRSVNNIKVDLENLVFMTN